MPAVGSGDDVPLVTHRQERAERLDMLGPKTAVRWPTAPGNAGQPPAPGILGRLVTMVFGNLAARPPPPGIDQFPRLAPVTAST